MTKKTIIISLCLLLSSYGDFLKAAGNAAAGKEKSAACASCHGESGNSIAPLFPKLAGQHASYLTAQLRAFKAQERVNPTMNALAAPLSDQDIADLSAYFASQPIKTEKVKPDPLGKKIYRRGIAKNQVPACSGCHGPNGKGNGPAGFPALRAQYTAYVVKALNDFAAGERGQDPSALIMQTIASRLTDEEKEAVAGYISGLR